MSTTGQTEPTGSCSRLRYQAALLTACSACVIAGCGSASSSTTNGFDLAVQSPPSASECGFQAPSQASTTGHRAGHSTSPPAAGVYRYITSGSESLPGESGSKQLPLMTTITVTPAAAAGGLTCFGDQRRYSPTITATEVYIIRGQDIYIVGFGSATPNYVQAVAPRPAILALSGTATEWSGVFGGATSGTYEVTIVGRRRFRVGGTNVQAVGLRSRATYTGESTGSRSLTTWLAIDRSLVIEESATSLLKFGGDTERLSYHTRLVSLRPNR